MKSFLKFLVIFTSILLLSAVLAPILFKFLPFKFERIFNRLVMIGSLLAIVLFVRIRLSGFAKYGLAWKPDSLGYFLKAYGLVVFILVGLTAFKIFIGEARWQPQYFEALRWARTLGNALGAGLIICLIEEFFFRGFILQTLRDKFVWPLWLSILGTNIFYALIHFVSDKSPFVGPNPRFYDSLRLMGAPFSSLAHWPEIWPAAVGLFIFGLILTDLVLRTKSLYPAMGLHAGAVLFVKSDGLFVDFSSSNPLLFGTKNGYDGVLGWGFLIFLWVLTRFLIRAKTEENKEALV